MIHPLYCGCRHPARDHRHYSRSTHCISCHCGNYISRARIWGHLLRAGVSPKTWVGLVFYSVMRRHADDL